jgi:hypothetical protein
MNTFGNMIVTYENIISLSSPIVKGYGYDGTLGEHNFITNCDSKRLRPQRFKKEFAGIKK